MTTLFALFAEVERDLISERTREGLAQARASAGSSGVRKARWAFPRPPSPSSRACHVRPSTAS